MEIQDQELSAIAVAAVVALLITGANTTTVSVSNQRRAELASSPIYVTCYEGLVQRPSQTIRPGQEIAFQLNPPADGLGCFCVGRFSEMDEMGKPRYYIYDSLNRSNYGYGKCGSSGCRVKANETSFYGWNEGKREWVIIMPKTWLP